jgi:putative DNA primase/helicase
MTWISDKTGQRSRRNLIAMANGLIDLDALLEGKPSSECILPHSPEWFSSIRLPYAFDKNAQAPKWLAFLERNLEMDLDRINLLQEWAGYLLLPDTGQQKFLVLEGDGSNGKSVYCAAIAGMLGSENCSHVPLEQFGERFSKTQTLGKLVNICADVGELDKVAEGYLKSFTSGDVMFFDRKGIAGVECIPTARLMFACNNRPRFSDRSSGIWRRMLIIPWMLEIAVSERVPNMDKAWWWEQQGELPGIFLWALRGLVRLRQQGRFTESLLSKEAVEEYREESNPARAFLKDHCEASSASAIHSSFLYEHYGRWAARNGYRPLSERVFGKEVRRVFPKVERKKGGGRTDRYWYYQGINFSVDEICGEKTSDSQLF